MTDDQQTIEDYTRAFERHLAGSAQEKAWARAELVAHLSDAADAGELADALRRLGTPESAAETFAPDRSAPLAPIGPRVIAALIDNLPLVGVTIALLVLNLVRVVGQGGSFAAVFPPFVYLQIGESCVGLVPVQCGHSAYRDAGLLYDVGVPLALAWSIIGLGVLEARTGTTLGKRYRGLKVVTEAGLRVPVLTGIARRLSFLAGPLAWLDWLPVLWGQRRRVADHLAGTKVVLADPARHRPRGTPAR